MCVVFLCLVAFVPWPGSSNIVALVSCVALEHFTVRATLEAILEHGAPGPHGDRPTVSRDPLSPPCPRPPSFRGAQAGRSHSGHRLGGLGCCCHARRGDGTTLGTDVGVDLPVVKRLFGAIWVISAKSRRWFLFWGPELALPSPGGTAEQTQLCHGDAPGLEKGSGPTSLGNRSGSFSFFIPDLGGRIQLVWESQARPFPAPQCRPRSAPSRPRSARLRRKLLLMPLPLVWTLSFRL